MNKRHILKLLNGSAAVCTVLASFIPYPWLAALAGLLWFVAVCWE